MDKRAHEGPCCLLAPRSHPRESQCPVILQAVPRGVEGVLRPVLRDLDRDVVQVARGVGVVGDEGVDILRHFPRIPRMTSCTTFGGARVLTWVRLLPWAVLTRNSQENSSTGYTPPRAVPWGASCVVLQNPFPRGLQEARRKLPGTQAGAGYLG